GLPLPQTLAGALRTALLARHGFDFAGLSRRRRRGQDVRDALRQGGAPEWVIGAHFRGPWLALRDSDRGPVEPLLPVPQTLARSGRRPDQPGVWVRSWPEKSLPGWEQPIGLLPLWRKGHPDAKHPGGFLTLGGIGKFLRGETPDDDDWLEPRALYDFDLRTGI